MGEVGGEERENDVNIALTYEILKTKLKTKQIKLTSIFVSMGVVGVVC